MTQTEKLDALLREARDANGDGRGGDALQAIAEAFELATSDERAEFTRESIPLLEWEWLAKTYAPAHEALRRVRDRQARLVLDGQLTYGAAPRSWPHPKTRFSLVARMNRALGDPQSTYDLFARLDAARPDYAARTLPMFPPPGEAPQLSALLGGFAQDADHARLAGSRREGAAAGIETERLILRPFTLDDAEAWLPLISLPEVIRYTGDSPAASVEEARELLRSRPLRDYALHGYGRLAVVEKASGRLVGFCGFKYVEDLGEIDIGYRFLPDCWGKGYATESAQALIEQGRRANDIARVVATVHPDNPASGRVLEKLGLRFERHLAPDEAGVRFLLYAADLTK